MATVVHSAPQILHAIVGTAGHVDHGKTSLVKLLTGCETDRLPEERARGMSIDLGFAPCLLHGRRVVGIVDVPGHKDFIRNMMAGASSVDVLLLVVAADDGVMPQTDEHMKIVKLLRTPQVMVALTKIDMVSAEMLEVAKADVAEFLARCGYAEAPIVPVSNKTGEGIGEVRETIDALVEQVRRRAPDARAFRMNVERVFSVKGYGTVATGIPVSGEAPLGEKLQLLPAGSETAVRTVQSYKQEAEAARANCCCAINLRDVEAQQVARGMTLGAPGVYRATREAIVQVANLADDVMLKRRMDVVLHSGTAAANASVKLLEAEYLAPGETAFAHVAMDEPLVLAAGDRFVLRQPSPAQTLGGGVVLSASAPRMRRHVQWSARLAAALEAVNAGQYSLAEMLAGSDVLVSESEALRLTQCTGSAGRDQLATAVAQGRVVDLAGSYVARLRVGELVERLRATLQRYHAANPYAWGMTPNHVCEELELPPRSFAALARVLGEHAMVVKHGRLALASYKPPISERLMQLRDVVLAAVESAGVLGVARGDLARQHAISEPDLKLLGKLLAGDGTVLLLDGNFILRSVYDASRAKLLALFADRAVVELAAFRDAIGGTRKMAVAMLDAFDAEGLTRRVGDGRVLMKKETAHAT